MNEPRLCKLCNILKDISEYSCTTKHILSTGELREYKRKICDKCRLRQRRERQNLIRHTPEFKEKKRLSIVKWRHGMGADEYLEMVEKQENLCAICGSPPGSRALAIDHNHITNKTRELLCVDCNFGLGRFRDNIEVMKKAIIYIEKHEKLDSLRPERETLVDWGSGKKKARIMRRMNTTNRNIVQR